MLLHLLWGWRPMQHYTSTRPGHSHNQSKITICMRCYTCFEALKKRARAVSSRLAPGRINYVRITSFRVFQGLGFRVRVWVPGADILLANIPLHQSLPAPPCDSDLCYDYSLAPPAAGCTSVRKHSASTARVSWNSACDWCVMWRNNLLGAVQGVPQVTCLSCVSVMTYGLSSQPWRAAWAAPYLMALKRDLTRWSCRKAPVQASRMTSRAS